MSLDQFVRFSLCHRPTPLEPLNRLSEYLGGPQLYIKRDDCTGLAGGGNKTRKLEYLIADAIQKGADTIITTGGVQSNHARQTAAAAAKIGLRCELVLPRIVNRSDLPYESSGNILLDRLLGASVNIVNDRESAEYRIQELTDVAAVDGAKVYFIPPGGSTPIGALGYVSAMQECIDQAEEVGIQPTHHVVVTGSGGTHAGLCVGLLQQNCKPMVCGFAIAHDGEKHRSIVKSLATETASLLGLSPDSQIEQILVNDEFRGPGYGVPTADTLAAISLTAQLEGVLLDPVYTGKAMAGLIALSRRGHFASTDQIVFWHTGGTPALFAYQHLFEE